MAAATVVAAGAAEVAGAAAWTTGAGAAAGAPLVEGSTVGAIEDEESAGLGVPVAGSDGSLTELAALLGETDAELISAEGLPTTRGLIESEMPMTATAQMPTATTVADIDSRTRART